MTLLVYVLFRQQFLGDFRVSGASQSPVAFALDVLGIAHLLRRAGRAANPLGKGLNQQVIPAGTASQCRSLVRVTGDSHAQVVDKDCTPEHERLEGVQRAVWIHADLVCHMPQAVQVRSPVYGEPGVVYGDAVGKRQAAGTLLFQGIPESVP